ncbi:MAG: hypothetical protein JSS68_13355 [Actinobacteria bacterium]|nr:hypothetical protein [Actinomycetota bacterium]
MPHDHRLSRRKRLPPADLAAETFVTQPSSTPQHWRGFWLLVDQIGSRPAISPHVADKLDDWLLLIGQGEGVDTAPAVISRYYPWPEVAFVPLVDAPPATLALALAWRHQPPDPRVRQTRARRGDGCGSEPGHLLPPPGGRLTSDSTTVWAVGRSVGRSVGEGFGPGRAGARSGSGLKHWSSGVPGVSEATRAGCGRLRDARDGRVSGGSWRRDRPAHGRVRGGGAGAGRCVAGEIPRGRDPGA